MNEELAYLLSRADVRGPSDCWPWTLSLTAGYGHYSWRGTQGTAHRRIYELAVGPVPAGLALDHQCHTAAVMVNECAGGHDCEHRRCVNPAHLEPVTRLTNLRRGYPATKQLCHRGHPLSGDNLFISSGRRCCRACQSVNYRIRRDRAIEEAKARGEWQPWEPVTECVNGHPYSGENLRLISTTGKRVCRACELERGRRYKARKRAERLFDRADVERLAAERRAS